MTPHPIDHRVAARIAAGTYRPSAAPQRHVASPAPSVDETTASVLESAVVGLLVALGAWVAAALVVSW